MGCGCGGRKKVRSQSVMKKVCPKCSTLMGYKQKYSPRAKGYIKTWECPRCGNKVVYKK